jgi:hypothetical protein
MKRTTIALTLGAAAALFATPALADDVKTAQVQSGGSAGLLLGYGFDDLYKVGFGVRGGYTLPQMPIYVGGTFVYHLGTSEDFPGGSATINVMMIGAEGGYELAAGPVIVRPYAGLGIAVFKESVPSVTIAGVTAGGGSASTSKLYFSPGATVLYPVTPNIGLGVDARYVISDESALDLMLTGQYHF